MPSRPDLSRATPSTGAQPPSDATAEPLSVQRIVAAAIELVEREGPAALTMRRLGDDLGVQAMSLYHHLASRDELLEEMAGALLQPLGDLEPAADWRATCQEFARGTRALAVAHPATFSLTSLQPLETAAALRGVERLLQALTAAGFSPHDALATYRAIASFARGYALAEVAGFTVDAAGDAGAARLRALPASEFPVLSGRLDELTGLHADAAFEHGLTALVDGLPRPA